MKKILIAIGLIIVLGGLYYGIAPLFNVQEVDDALPPEVSSGLENLSEEDRAEMSRLMDDANATEQPMTEDEQPVAMVDEVKRFPVMGTFGHPASGTVRVVETTEGRILRFEDFETINGPSINLYLSKDLEASEFIDLGPIRGTRGNINYTLPDDIDLSEYRYVMHWCVPFRVLFNYADLASE